MPRHPPRQQIRLRAISPGGLAAGETLLPLPRPGSTCAVRLRCIPGASSVHLVLDASAGVRLRAEVPAIGGEVVDVQVELDQDGALRVWTPGREVFLLPADDLYDPATPILPPPPDASLDLVLLIDGTISQISRDGQALTHELLLERRPLWESHVEKLLDFVERLGFGRRDCRAAVVAFADQPPPDASAKDLLPRYHLFPAEEERRFHRLDRNRLLEALLAIPASSGGDFVDALGDALDACARLHWRQEARKLLVLSGDSPGLSLLRPLRRGADLGAREKDVDTQGLRLHRLGVETVTIYHAPAEAATFDLEVQRDLLRSASDQYARLAALPEWAFRASTFDPARAAVAVGSRSGLLGRGAALGELVEVLAAPGAPERQGSTPPPPAADGGPEPSNQAG